MKTSAADAHHRTRRIARALCSVALALAVGTAVGSAGDTVPVRHVEGVIHGFLVLRTLSGEAIANGDLIQTSRGPTVTSRLVFRFNDGSIHDETAVFTQSRRFRLVSDHLRQRGPTFPHPLDMRIDARTRVVTVHTEDDGHPKEYSEKLDADDDVVNGLLLTVLKNLRPAAGPVKFAFVAATPKPQVVTLSVSSAGTERFETGGYARRAVHYVVKIEIGGLKGVLASVFGKEPPDSHVWVLADEVPSFVRSEQPLYAGGPVWRIELVAPRRE
jgi:hypothetical protein